MCEDDSRLAAAGDNFEVQWGLHAHEHVVRARVLRVSDACFRPSFRRPPLSVRYRSGYVTHYIIQFNSWDAFLRTVQRLVAKLWNQLFVEPVTCG